MAASERYEPNGNRLGRDSGRHRISPARAPGFSNGNFAAETSLDPIVCCQALRSRDRRFDGRFFAGVSTTRIYCRTICPVPLPKTENIRWFPTAAAAEAAGFRPCRRCRPQISPGTPAWFGTQAVVTRALKLILDGGLDAGNVNELADRVGIGARHLRRLFVQHLGASPIRIAQVRRAHSAKSLIEETKLPITDIAFRSGFTSIRQFNQVMHAAFDSSPSALRRSHSGGGDSGWDAGMVIHLPYLPPLDWPALIGFLRPRATPGVEIIDQSCYRRTIEVDGDAGEIEVRPDEHRPWLRARVRLKRYEHLIAVVERMRRLFDLFADPIQILSRLSNDPRLRGLVQARPGLRLPGTWDGFEIAVQAVLGDGLGAPGRKDLVANLVRTFGQPIKSPWGLTHLFPHPEILAHAELSLAGLADTHAVTIRELAIAVTRKQISFEAFYTLHDAISRLRDFPGIDETTAHYIAMRAFGEPDAFPFRASDVCVSNPGVPVSCGELLELTENWRPWCAYAAMYLEAAKAANCPPGPGLRAG